MQFDEFHSEVSDLPGEWEVQTYNKAEWIVTSERCLLSHDKAFWEIDGNTVSVERDFSGPIDAFSALHEEMQAVFEGAQSFMDEIDRPFELQDGLYIATCRMSFLVVVIDDYAYQFGLEGRPKTYSGPRDTTYFQRRLAPEIELNLTIPTPRGPVSLTPHGQVFWGGEISSKARVQRFAEKELARWRST